jgi:tetratricopeptide (TPR) repeat protein
MCIYIVASAESLNEERAAVFLRKQIGTRRDFPDDVKLCLGLICQKTGQLDLARGYLSSVDSNATTWPLLAEACFKTEAYRDAEKYQRLYLNDLDVAPADQLIFLGDICAQLGKEAEAQEAYNAAVESIRLKHNEAIEPSKAIETSPQPNISTSYSP